MAYTLTWEPHGVLLTSYGVVSAPTFARAQVELYGDPRFDRARYALVDFSAAHGLADMPVDIEEFTASTRGAFLTNPNVRVAVITADPALQAFMLRMTAVSAYPLRIFATMNEARTWGMADCLRTSRPIE